MGIHESMSDDDLADRIDKINAVLHGIDPETVVLIKGHLLIEESFNLIIETFIHHPSKIQKANLSFFQKFHIVRSMSLTAQDSDVWPLIEQFNSLRNDYAHKLSSNKRLPKIKSMKGVYRSLCPKDDMSFNEETDDLATFYTFVITYILGFLGEFEAEVMRFRDVIKIMDKSLNRKEAVRPS